MAEIIYLLIRPVFGVYQFKMDRNSKFLLLKRLILASHKADLPKRDAHEKKNGQNLGLPDLSLTLNIILHSLVFLNLIFITILASWSPECGLFHPNTSPKTTDTSLTITHDKTEVASTHVSEFGTEFRN